MSVVCGAEALNSDTKLCQTKIKIMPCHQFENMPRSTATTCQAMPTKPCYVKADETHFHLPSPPPTERTCQELLPSYPPTNHQPFPKVSLCTLWHQCIRVHVYSTLLTTIVKSCYCVYYCLTHLPVLFTRIYYNY